jgi:drug/metabolite transporter (DMT)-like permease
MLVTFLSPVSAILLAVTFLGERMTLTQLGGMALIFTGLAVADGRVIGWLGRRLAAKQDGPKLGP